MKSNEGGFTLIELILVMVIIGILSGAVSLNISGRVTDANIARVQSDLRVYQTAIDLFQLDNNDQLPRSLNDLVGGRRNYVNEVKDDPWGNPYHYRAPGRNNRKYDLFSAGPDGQPGTDDDISVWSED